MERPLSGIGYPGYSSPRTVLPGIPTTTSTTVPAGLPRVPGYQDPCIGCASFKFRQIHRVPRVPGYIVLRRLSRRLTTPDNGTTISLILRSIQVQNAKQSTYRTSFCVPRQFPTPTKHGRALGGVPVPGYPGYE